MKVLEESFMDLRTEVNGLEKALQVKDKIIQKQNMINEKMLVQRNHDIQSNVRENRYNPNAEKDQQEKKNFFKEKDIIVNAKDNTINQLKESVKIHKAKIKIQEDEIEEKDEIIQQYKDEIEEKDEIIQQYIDEIEEKDEIIQQYKDEIEEKDEIIQQYIDEIEEQDTIILFSRDQQEILCENLERKVSEKERRINELEEGHKVKNRLIWLSLLVVVFSVAYKYFI